MWFLASPIAFRKLLFPWDACFCFHTFIKVLQSLTINFKGTQILLNIQKYVPRGVLQTCSESTGEDSCICVVFINLSSRFGCSAINLVHICRIPFCHFVRKPLGDCFWIFVISNFTRFVIQVKQNLHAYIVARLIDENKYIYRFHASFSALRVHSTTKRLMKNSCCEIFNIIFEAQVMPFPPHFYAKQKLFLRNYPISFIFAFQEHQKCIFKASRKAKMQMIFRLFNFYRHAAGLDITDVPTANYSWTNLLRQCQTLRCQRLDQKFYY